MQLVRKRRDVTLPYLTLEERRSPRSIELLRD